MAETLIIISSVLIAFGHFFGVFFGWYWNPGYWWLDIILHFLGGFFVASFVWWFGNKFPQLDIFHRDDDFQPLKNNIFKNFIIFIAISVLIGVFWEFFEFGYDYFLIDSGRFVYLDYAQLSKSDTMGDLFMDFAGATVAALIFLLFRPRASRHV